MTNDDFYDRGIILTARGEKDMGWPLDKWPARGANGERLSWEQRFNGGDKQALLWAIEECGEKKEPIPTWAHEALRGKLLGIAKGELGKTWDGAFGRVFYERKGLDNTRRLVRRVRRLGERILQLWNGGHSLGDGDNSVWDVLSGDRKRLKDDWKLYKKLAGLPERMTRKQAGGHSRGTR